jgi:signal transduction histidine kinase/CheY-like chemotaxis protein
VSERYNALAHIVFFCDRCGRLQPPGADSMIETHRTVAQPIAEGASSSNRPAERFRPPPSSSPTPLARLAEFMMANIQPILAEWDVFARNIWPGAAVDTAALRDDAEDILRATVSDMQSDQTAAQQSDKSKGHDPGGEYSRAVNRASKLHAVGRLGSGFDLSAVVAEYRALRASVIRLWRESGPLPDLRDLEDMTRFNECMDQSLTEAVRSYTVEVERERGALLAREQASRIEAETANRAKDLFLATLSHELRTPLSAIIGWIDILHRSNCDAADLTEGLAVIARNAKAQAQLINDVLDVSRIVSGKLRMEIGSCQLTEIVNAGIGAVRPAAVARGIALHVQLDPTASNASCDAARIQQVVWNLVSNAVKFTPKGGHIIVTLTREQSSFRIEVSDNGQGINSELLPYVFDRFRQADSSARRKFGGLGLGLSIVKHIVEQHGGTVQARSAGEGRGSTFIVCLPIPAMQSSQSTEEYVEAEIAAGELLAEASGRAALGPPLVRLDGLRVLIVDDEADARRLMGRFLEEVGAIVTAAGSAAEALEILPKFQPEVLVSDLGMPHQDGCDLIRQVRSRGHHPRDLPAVALTAYVNKDDQHKALSAGFQVHVSKPATPHHLASVIASLAGRSA